MVDLLVCVDVALPPPVPSNVRQAVNVYMSQQLIYPADPLRPAVGGTTSIDNIDVNDPSSFIKGRGLHHLNITANPTVQDYVMERILQVVGETPR